MQRRDFIQTTVALTCCGTSIARAQTPSFPSRPIRIVVPYPPGGSADTLARVIGKPLGEQLGQPVVIENKPGANGAIGARDAASASADGHTLVLVTDGMYSILPHMLPPGGRDYVRELAPVIHLMDVPLIIVAREGLGARTLPELIQLAKANPDKLTFAANNTASTHYIAFEQLKKEAGIRLRHIPFAGTAQALTALLGGQVDVMVGTAQSKAQIDRSQLSYLAVTTAQRLPLLPQVPSVSETLQGYDQPAALGLMVSRGTPVERVAQLNAAVDKVLADLQVIKAIVEVGAGIPRGGSAAQFGTLIKGQREARGPLIRELGVGT